MAAKSWHKLHEWRIEGTGLLFQKQNSQKQAYAKIARDLDQVDDVTPALGLETIPEILVPWTLLTEFKPNAVLLRFQAAGWKLKRVQKV